MQVHPSPGGRTCPKKLIKSKKCFINCNKVADEPKNETVDCLLSSWTSWSLCDSNCSKELSVRQRFVLVQPKNGKPCGETIQRKPCPCIK